jgi:hypothetical protein
MMVIENPKYEWTIANLFRFSMKSNFKDMTGQRVHRWTVLAYSRRHPRWGHAEWQCRCDCGKEKVVSGPSLRNGKSQSCGCLIVEISRNRPPHWKTGKRRTKQGYVISNLKLFPDVKLHYPNRQVIGEHVAMMSRRLGRPLLPDETVHHKNGIRDDNTDDNLELRVRAKHPSGASVEDLLQWADELIARYRG